VNLAKVFSPRNGIDRSICFDYNSGMIKFLTASDLESVCKLANSIYFPDLYESDDKFAQLLAIYPQGQFGFFDSDKLVAYLFSHPWFLDQIVPLDSLVVLPTNPTCYYLHDLAVSSDCRGRGIAKAMYQKALELAGDLPIKLVSIRNDFLGINAHEFWRHLGFVTQSPVYYGNEERVEALVMIRIK